jgi:hypothetical protein
MIRGSKDASASFHQFAMATDTVCEPAGDAHSRLACLTAIQVSGKMLPKWNYSKMKVTNDS